MTTQCQTPIFCTPLSSKTPTRLQPVESRKVGRYISEFQHSLQGILYEQLKPTHITPILGSLHWLKINERIYYKLMSLTYKVLTTSQPDYLYTILSLFSLQVEPAPRLLSPCSTIRIFLITNHQPLFQICITSPVESAPIFIPSQPHSVHCPPGSPHPAHNHFITVTTIALTIYRSLDLSLQT